MFMSWWDAFERAVGLNAAVGKWGRAYRWPVDKDRVFLASRAAGAPGAQGEWMLGTWNKRAWRQRRGRICENRADFLYRESGFRLKPNSKEPV